MTVGVLIMSMVGVSASYLVLLLGIVVMASGIALAMSPTTDLLMSAVPRDKAGMGSAMNDTTRELGTSLGVAVFGSLLASRYADALAGTVSSLPVQAREVARGSLGGALQVAGTLEPSRGGSLVAAAKDAWVSGFRLSLLGGALVIAVAAAIAYRFLPDQAHDVAAHRMVPVPRAGDGPAIAAEPAIAAD
ncbi:MAG: hypothetical protein R2755_23155 [Acidimicrobiales bacterium]